MYKLNMIQKLMCNFDISVSLKVRVVYGSCKFCWPKGEKFTLKHGTNFIMTFTFAQIVENVYQNKHIMSIHYCMKRQKKGTKKYIFRLDFTHHSDLM